MNNTVKETLLDLLKKESFEEFMKSIPSKEYWDDKEIVLEVLKNSHYTYILEFASERLKNDKDIIKEAIKHDACALTYASDGIKNDKDVVLFTVSKDGTLLGEVSDRLRDDKDVVLVAVTTNPSALAWASDRLRDDKDVVMAALSNGKKGNDAYDIPGMALSFASDNLKADREIVELAIKGTGAAIVYASDELKDDKELVKKAYSNNHFRLMECEIIEHISERLKKDEDIMILSLESGEEYCWIYEVDTKNPKIIKLCEEERIKCVKRELINCSAELSEYDEYNDNKEIVMIAVTRDGNQLEYASNRLKNDKDIVMAAVTQDGWSLEYASDELKKDKDVIKRAIKTTANALVFANEDTRNNKEFVIRAIEEAENKKIYGILEFLSDELRDDKDIVLKVIEYGDDFAFVSERLRSDKDVVLKAIKSNWRNIQYADKTIINDIEIINKVFSEYKNELSECKNEIIGYQNEVVNCINESITMLNIIEDIVSKRDGVDFLYDDGIENEHYQFNEAFDCDKVRDYLPLNSEIIFSLVKNLMYIKKHK